MQRYSPPSVSRNPVSPARARRPLQDGYDECVRAGRAHFLAQVIYTFKHRIADRGAEAQQFRASGLVIAAIVYWNSTYIADAVAHLRVAGEVVPEALLAHTTPLSWEHIGLSGDFLWDHAAATTVRRRPLNLGRNRAAA